MKGVVVAVAIALCDIAQANGSSAEVAAMATLAEIEKLLCEVASQKMIEDKATIAICTEISKKVKIPDCQAIVEKGWDKIVAKCPKSSDGQASSLFEQNVKVYNQCGEWCEDDADCTLKCPICVFNANGTVGVCRAVHTAVDHLQTKSGDVKVYQQCGTDCDGCSDCPATCPYCMDYGQGGNCEAPNPVLIQV